MTVSAKRPTEDRHKTYLAKAKQTGVITHAMLGFLKP